MGKSSRAKKAKKADFVKPKLKVGKKLKKAQNETRTEFKARKIILKEQLALKSTKALVTKKRHDVQELISRLSYHNVYVRQDGVNGLRELVNHYDSALLLPHLSTFVMRATPCILDPDPLIRNSVTKFLEALIIKMGPSIEPYFTILATHLSCAMVHLNIGVQGDSLQLMRVLIKYTPSLIARHANTVFTNFLNLISRKTAITKAAPKPEEKPALKFDFSSLIQTKAKTPSSGHVGHLALLVELSNFLEAILAEQGRIQDEVPHTMWETVVMGSVPPLPLHETTTNKSEELWLFTDPVRLEQFTNTVITLLMQLWLGVDIDRSEDSSAGGNALNEEGVDTLRCIVNIIMHIWRITQICTQKHPKKCRWLKMFFSSDFMQRIMSGFPFCCQVTPLHHKKKKKDKEAVKNQQEEQEKRNLKHCDDLNVLLALFGTHMAFKGHRSKSINFFATLLRDGNRDGEYNMKSVVHILKELMFPTVKEETQTIISAAYTCYARLHPLKKDRALLLDLLLLVTEMSYKYMWNYKTIYRWVEDIVKDLIAGNVREATLKAAIDLRLRDNTNIKSLLSAHNAEIREAVMGKGVQGLTSDQLELKLHFLLKK